MQIIRKYRHLDVLMPKFVSRFSCIGPVCEFSCCQAFEVSLDKKTFEAYFKLPEFKKEYKQIFQKYPKKIRTDASFGKIDAVSGKHCPFFQDRLCQLHKKYGSDILSNTCDKYPRHFYISKYQEHTELILTLSCPEAVRLAFFHEDAFEFVVHEQMRVREEVLVEMNFGSKNNELLVLDLRYFVWEIVRFQDLELWKRMALLGLFAQQYEEIFNKSLFSDEHAYRQLIQEMTAFIQSGEIDGIYDVVATNESLYFIKCVQLLKNFLHFDASKSDEDNVTLQIDRSFMKGKKECTYDELLTNYQYGERILNEALKEYPYFLEHLLFSNILYFRFPSPNIYFKSPKEFHIFSVYKYIVWATIFIRFCLVAFCANKETVTIQELTSVLYRLFRRFQHVNYDSYGQLLELAELEWNELSDVYVFLKTALAQQ